MPFCNVIIYYQIFEFILLSNAQLLKSNFILNSSPKINFYHNILTPIKVEFIDAIVFIVQKGIRYTEFMIWSFANIMKKSQKFTFP